MARNTKTDQLRGVEMCSACTDKELAQIARACDEVAVDADAVTVALRGPGSRRESSPKYWPGARVATG